MQLRTYQSEAVEAVIRSLKEGYHPVVQLPTGSGKSLCVAAVVDYVRSKGGNVWVITHVQELVRQNHKTLERFAGTHGTGVMCAGLDSFNIGDHVTFGTVQTFAARIKRHDFDPPDAIIVDECHRIPPGKEGKLYSSIFQAFPQARRIGFTATPWRLDGGRVYAETENGNAENAKDLWFDVLSYVKTPEEMVAAGYLCPLIGVSTEVQIDLTGVHKSNGDYKQTEVAEHMPDPWLEGMANSVIKLAENRKRIAVYCPTVESANKVRDVFINLGQTCGVITGNTPNRAEVLNEWGQGLVRIMCSVDVLTTGFDLPVLDCLVSLRPTESSALWVQILGRGTRTFEGKKNCLVLDFAGNLLRLGGLGCIEKGYFQKGEKVEQVKNPNQPLAKPKVKRKAEKGNLEALDPMMGSSGTLVVEVEDVIYRVIGSKSQPGKRLLMVNYSGRCNGHAVSASRFICVEYHGWARVHAEHWFRERGATAPRDAETAQKLCYSLPLARRIEVKRNGKYLQVEKEHLL